MAVAKDRRAAVASLPQGSRPTTAPPPPHPIAKRVRATGTDPGGAGGHEEQVAVEVPGDPAAGYRSKLQPRLSQVQFSARTRPTKYGPNAYFCQPGAGIFVPLDPWGGGQLVGHSLLPIELAYFCVSTLLDISTCKAFCSP